MIFRYFWMKKYRILFDIINDSIRFSLGFYMHFGTFSYLIFLMPIEEIKKILKTKQQ